MSERLQMLISQIKSHPSLGKILAMHERLPGSPVRFEDDPLLLPPVLTALQSQGIFRLYSHQVEALRRIREGKSVVIATPTASGKTLSYFIPVIESALTKNGRAIFMYPLKALENDQLRKWEQFTKLMPLGNPPRALIYDGDTPDPQRKLIRKTPPHALFTTPDMLHLGILPYHALWKDFIASLSLIVVDELHTYRGLFGTHMALVFRRLRRVCERYGAKPQFLATSATIANAQQLGEMLFGGDTVAIEESGAPRPARNVMLFNPEETSAFTETARLFTLSVTNGLRTLVFTRSRQETERMYQAIAESAPSIANKISAYRAGYLPEERREIESRLATGDLLGVISTSALELGIDIGGLDVCILSGFPGLIAQTWQRWGRVGRGDSEAMVALVASPNALDQYLLRHPEELFSRPFESANINSNNANVLDAHLQCAAQEIPLRLEEPWLQNPKVRDRMDASIAAGNLIEAADGGQWFSPDQQPQRKVDIRSAGSPYIIQDQVTGKKIGEVSGNTVFRECHPNAVYLHNGRVFVVTALDPSTSNILVTEPSPPPPYYTMPRTEKETEILEELESRTFGEYRICFGRLKVHEQVVAYERRQKDTRRLENVFPLDLPETVFETTGAWIEMPASIIERWTENGYHFPGARHATEHALLAMLPLIALCDRNDVGGITLDIHEQTRCPTIFLYDGFTGGAGLVETGYRQWEEWLRRSHQLVNECPCQEIDGCPSCIQSPKCGSGNRPLDKKGCIALLEFMRNGKHEQSVQSSTIVARHSKAKPEIVKTQQLLPRKLEETGTVYFDIETLRSADDVGGWGKINLMGIALAVVFDERTQQYTTYREKDVQQLIAHLDSAELVIGYNTLRFDYEVLRGYVLRDFKEWRSFDMLVEVQQRYGGKRLPLSALAKATLNNDKSADGLQSLQWVKEGKWNLIEEYCTHDVQLTRDLFKFGLERGYLLTEDRRGMRLKIALDWNLDKILGSR
ncbi:MAG: DEAD/DEAH box helicase [bacterium]|nr:DEAD/DEAH box helicase [bacterium]